MSEWVDVITWAIGGGIVCRLIVEGYGWVWRFFNEAPRNMV